MYKKLEDGSFKVLSSRTASIWWKVSANIDNCNCPNFRYVLKGQGECKHMEEVRIGEENSGDFKSVFNPDDYKEPLSLDKFCNKYGYKQYQYLLNRVVVLVKGLVRKL